MTGWMLIVEVTEVYVCPYCDEVFDDADEHFEHTTLCDKNDEF